MGAQQASNFSEANFVYDGDGKRVKSVMTTSAGVTTTYFVGNYYEVSGNVVTKYYFAGGQRIAMRKANTLKYIIGDHLGSTSVVTDASGGLVSKMQYTASSPRECWREGEVRSGDEATRYQYTGQYSYAPDFGLLFYNARWYDPYITHFTSPDTIIPDNYNTLDFDRYQYARSNPLKYTDPSGHFVCDEVDKDGKCINYAQQNKRLHKKLDAFVQPDAASDDEMVAVGFIVTDQISPAEYALLLNKDGNIDYILLWQMYQIQQKALNTSESLFPGMDLHNDPADAFRHSYWNALMTRDFGIEFALSFSTAHETGYAPYPNREEVFMDLHNNGVGSDIAISSPNATDEQLQQKVMAALTEGDLYIWDGKRIYFSNMCPACFFP